ncbi:helix-turn-helix domain-containing protein [Ramlibacter rhizophilus]|uniref:Helix-turn-helix domain-containing protein n=1 Tax=Ramlibacter rhizophilus TaxID=1781167 RepID=A0A4Z0BWD8_9BURK|nr:helix-turn-helix domain-containing protein [Ramlibacter rhizophilus]TFZ03221.1 helix-turn-helix domain-containing protein [Ramlibacter rhizophilus]
MSETVAESDISAGALLRQAREGAGLHVAALAGALKVPQRQLEALEQDRLELLPDVVYARALAASVCRNLRLDPQLVLTRLPKGSDSRLGKDVPINVPFRATGDAAHSPVRALLLRPPVFAALALLVGALVLLALPLIPNRAPVADAPAASAADPAGPAGSVPGAPTGMVSETVTPPLAPAQDVAAAPAAAPAPASATAPATATAPVQAAPAPPAAAPVPTTAAATPNPAAAAGAPVVEFRASQPSWIQVTDPRGAVYLRRMVAAGEVVNVSGATPLQVVVGSASGTQVQVRGSAFDLRPFTRDNVARFEIR